jgi:hypothetical protein
MPKTENGLCSLNKIGTTARCSSIDSMRKIDSRYLIIKIAGNLPALTFLEMSYQRKMQSVAAVTTPGRFWNGSEFEFTS